MNTNLKKSLFLFGVTIIYVVIISSFFGDKFVSSDNNERIKRVIVSSEIYYNYPELIKKLDSHSQGDYDLVYLKQLETEYGVKFGIVYEKKRIFGTMVYYINIRDYSVGLIYGFFVSLVFLILNIINRNKVEEQEKKLASNISIYLNLFVVAPLVTLGLTFGLGSPGSGDFLPIGVIIGSLISLILLFVTILRYVINAKNIITTRAIIWGIIEPVIVLGLLFLVYPVYFALVH